MPPTLTISALTTPRPQPRARHVGGGKVVSTANGHAKAWRALLERQARLAIRDQAAALEAIRGRPIGVDAVFYFATRDASRWGRPHTAAPDRDNLDKLVLDVLVRAEALGGDDRRVADGRLVKVWAPVAGCVVTVRPWGTEPPSLADLTTGTAGDEPEPVPAVEGADRPGWLG